MRTTKPRRCTACKTRAGLVWRGNNLLCIDCDRASRPVHLTDADIAAALQAPRPVVTAKAAMDALERSERR